MDKTPKYTRDPDIVRAMRPLQKRAADLIIKDVLNNNPPLNTDEAIARYRDQLGEGFWIDNGNGWDGDIRDTSIFCLIQNGFVKGGAVKHNKTNNELTEWSLDNEFLEYSADLEIIHGSNRRQAEMRDKAMQTHEFVGKGKEAVYTYTDSLLDELGHSYTKIGKHTSSDLGSVATRVLSQYGTGNAGIPRIRTIFRTDDAGQLETEFHRHMKSENLHVTDGIGTEWFEIDHTKVAEIYTQLPHRK
ncbi:hypothetical protein GCM10008927_18810 [Amylibacter ulvae]|uniref:Uncharacterized protein n=1 Tax=Paramylibacter ulvae TaxID=1651968 RepID=A0ABQ3D148_9RHOB|nr:GIY-YIG nuclease family protein [Amylibacter ulvae]GHA53256.1 hypothetical protein GCM10008927_18810 [Amylibacter ulvae]